MKGTSSVVAPNILLWQVLPSFFISLPTFLIFIFKTVLWVFYFFTLRLLSSDVAQGKVLIWGLHLCVCAHVIFPPKCIYYQFIHVCPLKKNSLCLYDSFPSFIYNSWCNLLGFILPDHSNWVLLNCPDFHSIIPYSPSQHVFWLFSWSRKLPEW